MMFMKTLFSLLTRTMLMMSFVLFVISCDEKDKQASEEQARPVKAIQIGSVKSLNNRSFPGKARASQEVNLAFNVSGSLIELPINIGDKVKKGDLIAKLDPREFEAKLKAAKAEASRDDQNFQRAKALVGKGHISQADYDLIEAKLAISQSSLDLAEKAMVDSVITAPFDGKIANLYVENFQTIASGQVIARLLDTSQIEMVVQIPESAISIIPYVTNIVVEFDSFPKHLIPAEIKEISNEASPDTRTYPVTLVMKQPKDIEILPGMAGKVKGEVKKNANSGQIVVPSNALLTKGENGKTYVWVINLQTNAVHLREIKIGALEANGVSVLSGLQEEEWVVTAGIHTLKEGDKVTILKQKSN
jgi:RND family efflux transporter MFP subunit